MADINVSVTVPAVITATATDPNHITVAVTNPAPITVSAGGTVTRILTTAPITGGTITTTGTIGISAATDAAAGSMSASDKSKLDGIEAGAEVNNISDVNATALTDGGQTALHSHADGGGTVTSIATTAPITGGTITGSGTIGIDAATTLAAGSMSASDKTKLDMITVPEAGQVLIAQVGATVIGQVPFYSSITGGVTSDPFFIWDNTNKMLGLGVTPLWPLQLLKIYTDAATESYGLFSQTVYNVTTASAGTYRANYLQAFTSATSDNQGTVIAAYFNARGRGTGGTTTNLSSLVGATAIDAGSAAAYTNVNALQFTVSHAGTGTVTNMNGSSVTATLSTSGGAVDGNVSSAIGYAATISNTATAATPGVITNAYLFRANPPTGTAAITTMYGYYVGNMGRAGITTAYGINIQSQTGATNNYAIYTNAGLVRFGDVVLLAQATTAGAPAYQKGGLYFDTTLNKLRVGGATAWETVTSS